MPTPAEFIEQILKSLKEIKKKVEELEKELKLNNNEEDNYVFESLKRGLITLDMVDKKYTKEEKYVNVAVEVNIDNLKYVDKSIIDKFKDKKEFFINLLKENGLNLENMPDFIKTDTEACILAIDNNVEAFKFIGCEELLNDKSFVLDIVDKNGLMLEFVKEDLKKDFEVVITSLSNNNDAKQFISPEIKEKILSLFS